MHKNQIYMMDSDGEPMSEESDIGKYEKLFTPPKVKRQINTHSTKKIDQIQQSKSNTNEDYKSSKDSLGTEEDLNNDEGVYNVQHQILQENVKDEKNTALAISKPAT